jgi:hypothetical protein
LESLALQVVAGAVGVVALHLDARLLGRAAGARGLLQQRRHLARVRHVRVELPHDGHRLVVRAGLDVDGQLRLGAVTGMMAAVRRATVAVRRT